MKKLFNKNSLMLFFIILISLIKFGLAGKGFLAFVDERRYLKSFESVENLSEGNIQKAALNIFETQGRPGDAILKTIPAAGQYFSSLITDNSLYETNNAYPLFLFNYIIFGLLLIVHYKFSKLFLKDTFLSLFSVLALSALVASYISLRHADPYDASLLILYFTLYKIQKILFKENISSGSLFGYGFLAFFGYLCYPGYILFYGIILGVLVLNGLKKSTIKNKITQGIWFGAGSFTCLALFEIASRIAGQSFLVTSYFLSTSIKQGSFEECFSFLFKYLIQAEGINGIILTIGLILFIASAFIVIRRETQSIISPIYILFGVSFLIFMTYASAGYFFEFVVFYARLIKQFLPVIVLFFVFGLQQLFVILKSKPYIQTITIIGLSCLFVFQFCLLWNDYRTIFYPKDVAWEFYNKYHIGSYNEICESTDSWGEMPDFKNPEKNKIRSSEQKFTFVNVCGFYPFDNLATYKPFIPQKNQELLFTGRNCMKFKAYQFEAYTIQARKNFDSVNLDICVYRTK